MSMKWSSDAEASIFPSWLKLRVRTGQSSLQNNHITGKSMREKKEKENNINSREQFRDQFEDINREAKRNLHRGQR